MKEKVRRRLIERLKHEKHNSLQQRYHWALNSYVMSRILGKSLPCQREFGKYMIHLSVGMRYNYGYTFTQLRSDIRRKTDLWKLALRIGDSHAADLREAINIMEPLYNELIDHKTPLRDRGYEGLTIYQSVFPFDIEHKEWVRRQPKSRYKGYFKRRRKAERLKKARKKNWQSFEPKESEL